MPVEPDSRNSLLDYLRKRTTVALVIVFVLLGSGFVVSEIIEYNNEIEDLRTALIEQRKALLKDEINSVISMISYWRQEQPESNDQAVQERIKGWLVSQYRPTEAKYYFVKGMDGTEIVNPNNPDLVGKNLLRAKDETIRTAIGKIVRAGASPEGSFVLYDWKKPASDQISQKLSFVRSIPGWGWILGHGLYLDDINRAVDERSREVQHHLIQHLTIVLLAALLLLAGVNLFFRREGRMIGRELGRLMYGISSPEAAADLLKPENYQIAEFSKISQSIQANYLKLERIQKSKSATITELEISRQATLDALKEAKKANQTKTDFLANMSHELRTPLNSLLGISSLLAETPLTREQAEYIEMIQTSGGMLLYLVNDILDLSKIEAGEVILETIEIDPRGFVNEIVQTFALQAHVKGVMLTSKIDPTVPRRIFGDPIRLRQILSNLLSNAVKFTDHGSILLRVAPTDDTVEPGHTTLSFSVADTGCGIPAHKIPDLFQRFAQADSSLTRVHGGTGLGLVITRSLAQMMGGDVRVASAAGRGSTFTAIVRVIGEKGSDQGVESAGQSDQSLLLLTRFESSSPRLSALFSELGIRVQAQGLHEKLPESPFSMILIDEPEDRCIEELLGSIREHRLFIGTPIVLLSHHETEISRPNVIFCRKPLSRTSLKNVVVGILNEEMHHQMEEPVPVVDLCNRIFAGRILLVEDNIPNQLVARKLLEKCGVTVVIAENGKKALERFKEQPFDLVLMDIQMPEMNGYDATRAIRRYEAQHKRKPTPVVALTAHAFSQDRAQCLAAGMDEYLSKPISITALRQTLYHYCPQETEAASVA